MVNNAGVAPEIFGIAAQPGGLRAHETSMETFDITMRINTRGVFLGCKHALGQFLIQEPLPLNSRGDATRGWIVNVASLAGRKDIRLFGITVLISVPLFRLYSDYSQAFSSFVCSLRS